MFWYWRGRWGFGFWFVLLGGLGAAFLFIFGFLAVAVVLAIVFGTFLLGLAFHRLIRDVPTTRTGRPLRKRDVIMGVIALGWFGELLYQAVIYRDGMSILLAILIVALAIGWRLHQTSGA
jgi:hypothetical protein